MKIATNKDVNLLIGDIETLPCLVDLGFYNPDTKTWHEFQISQFKNNLYDFVSFYKRENWDFVVGYNWIEFDAQVIQFVLDNYSKWSNLTNLQITQLVYQYVQKIIENQNFGMFKEYREDQFEIASLDVFTILGLNNEARRSSLKKVQYQLDMPTVEEMPIHHSVQSLTEEEIKMITAYRRNDVLSTLTVFKLCLGDTEHPLFKGKNLVELRFNIKEEFDINCLSYSDIKIGDELLKINYAKAVGKEVWQLPKKGFFRKKIKLNKAIPDFVEFQTPQLQTLLKTTKSKEIGQFDKHEVEFDFKKTIYTIGLGGGHSDNTNQIWTSDEDNELVDLDVGSLYPAIIVNNSYFPFHLGKELLKVYTTLYHRRIELKPQSKKDKKIAGIVEAIKLILNSAYGKMGSVDSWMFDKQVQVNVCLTGQFSLLMLIESLELAGIHVFSFNTDGITLRLHKSKKEEFEKICKEWQEKTAFVLERVDYEKIIYSTVNDYLAIKKGYHEAAKSDKKDYLKFKGDFISDFELWKNKSWKVVALALQEYFIKGTNPVDFIKKHDNIFDFCIMARASGDLYLELQKEENGKIYCERLKKLVRYYLTNDKEWQLFKRGIGSTGKNANISSHADDDMGKIYVKYFNKFEDKSFHDYKVDVNRYIYKALKMIDKIEKSNKARNFITSISSTQQISLF